MQLFLKGAPNPETARVLERVFKLATAELGIAAWAAEVHAKIKEGKAEVTERRVGGRFYREVNGQMGVTSSNIHAGNQIRMLLWTFNTPQLISTFAHELTHAAQMLRGDLKHEDGWAVWKGRHYAEPRSVAEYENLPWEREANAFSAHIVGMLKQ
jgi:oligoendopeptidase F